MKTNLPIIVKYSPIRKLALIPFEKAHDTIYRGFELQYIDGEPYGKGYRVLAYRNDNYVDVYDDVALKFNEKEKFNVVENGLHKHVQSHIDNVQFCKENNNQIISFEFVDIQGRNISVYIEEKTKRKSKPMNLLAPIGVGSKKPEYLPVFFMYDFDFIRKSETKILCNIDGKNIRLDTFPMPMNGQARLYVRYSNECELMEFANTDMQELQEIELNEDNSYHKDNVEYLFNSENALNKVIVHFQGNDVDICFEAGLSLYKSCAGEFAIKPREQMGYLRGEYSVQCGDNTVIKMVPKYGWISKPNSFITRIILGQNSVFCSWSKKYIYDATIDLKSRKVKMCWKNENIK